MAGRPVLNAACSITLTVGRPSLRDSRVPVEVQNQIRMLGQPIAAEVARRRASHRRWLKLAPLKGDIQLLEVEAPIDVDPIEWPKSDDDCVIASVETFPSLPEAISALTERGVDTDAFDAVWKGDNPF